MKKVFFIASLTFVLLLSLFIGIASYAVDLKTFSYEDLSFELYSKFAGQDMDPFLTVREISNKAEEIPAAMKPYLKMIVNHAPRPKNGLKVKVFSKNYTIYFKNEKDWKAFKKTVLKVISYERKELVQKER